MKRIFINFSKWFCKLWKNIKKLFQRKTLFKKLLETYKDTDMDIATLTQLIDAFRAETRQDAITPDSLGQLLQKIVNLLGDAADASVVQSLTSWMDNLKSSQSLVKDIRMNMDAVSVTFTIEKVDATTGDSYTESLRLNYPEYMLRQDRANGYVQLTLTNADGTKEYSTTKLYGATQSQAGMMTAEDKRRVDNTYNGLNALADEVAQKATTDEVDNIKEWQDKIKDIGSVVKSVAVQADGSDMHLLVGKSDTTTGRATNDNILVPHATEQRAGVITAQEYAAMKKLINKEEEPVKTHYHIECETRGDQIFLFYDQELTRKGYVPYLFRYSIRRTHWGVVQTDSSRFSGPKKRGWHRFYDQNRIKLEEYEVKIGRCANGDYNAPRWDYNYSIVRDLFGPIQDHMKDGQISYSFAFGSRIHSIDRQNNSRRFKFGIAFGPPINEEHKNLFLDELVTNITEFHVVVKFEPDSVSNVQEAPELHFNFSK